MKTKIIFTIDQVEIMNSMSASLDAEGINYIVQSAPTQIVFIIL